MARNDDAAAKPATNLPDRQITFKTLSSPSRKIFRFRSHANQPHNSARLTADEGRSRSSRTCGEMRWTRTCATDVARWKRTAKSCGSGAAVLASSLREVCAGDGGKRAVLREEHEVSRKAIAQGRPECSRCPVCSCAVLFAQIARETAGAASTRSSLRPLFSKRGKRRCKPRAIGAARSRSCIRVGWVAAQAKPILSRTCMTRESCRPLEGRWPPPASERDCPRNRPQTRADSRTSFCNAAKPSARPLLTGNGNSAGFSVLVRLACKLRSPRSRSGKIHGRKHA